MKPPPPRSPAAKSCQKSRPAVVARARRLIADPNYPSDRAMRAVARLLARRFLM